MLRIKSISVSQTFLGKKSSKNTEDEAEKGEMTSLSSSDSNDDLLDPQDNEDKKQLPNSTENGNNDSHLKN